MPSAPLAAVTGAGGFIGRATVLRLLAAGWRVRRLLRRPPEVPFRGETVVGDLGDEEALRRLVAGADAVVHAAGINRAWRAAEYYDTNVDGAWRLGRAIRAASPSARMVVVSSLAARVPWLSAYAASKADGEDALVEAAGGRAGWAVLRLGPVYGPADRKTLAVLLAANRALMPVPDRPLARLSLLNVADAAAAIAAACAAGAPRGVVWEVGEGAYSWAEAARAVIRAVTGTGRVVPVAPPLLALGGVMTHPLGSGTLPLLVPGRAAELAYDDWVAGPIRQPPSGLWQVRVSLDAGLYRAVEWFRAHGRLPPPVVLAASRQRDRPSPQVPG